MLHLYSQEPLSRALRKLEEHPETQLLISMLQKLNNYYCDFLANDLAKRDPAGSELSALSQGFEQDDALSISFHKKAQKKALQQFLQEQTNVWSSPQRAFFDKHYSKLEKCLGLTEIPRITISQILADIFPQLRTELLSVLADRLLLGFINRSAWLRFDKELIQSTESYLAKTFVYQV